MPHRASLTGTLSLNGTAQLDYAAGGTIATIGTTGSLSINSAAARLSAAGDATANGALAGLLENDGTLSLTGPSPATSCPSAHRIMKRLPAVRCRPRTAYAQQAG